LVTRGVDGKGEAGERGVRRRGEVKKGEED